METLSWREKIAKGEVFVPTKEEFDEIQEEMNQLNQIKSLCKGKPPDVFVKNLIDETHELKIKLIKYEAV